MPARPASWRCICPQRTESGPTWVRPIIRFGDRIVGATREGLVREPGRLRSALRGPRDVSDPSGATFR